MPPTTSTKSRFIIPAVWLHLGFVLLTSFFTYFYNYTNPQAVFWDEPYHIASAQKYLNRIYFMEQHPPLGKMLIALGEGILNANENDSQFIGTDYATGVPETFKFAGYRLFPTLFGWLTAPLFFLIFFLMTKNPTKASLFSFLYIFDNALIVHSRGAMVDTPLTFFSILMIALFMIMLHFRDKRNLLILSSFLFGIAFGAVMTTKLVGLIMVLLVPAMMVALYPQWKKIGLFACAGFAGFILMFSGVWYMHYALGQKIEPRLPNNGYYQASDSYKRYLADGTTASLASFPVMLKDSMKYVTYYNRGVPRLDLCKPDENGSPFFSWPFGGRSINYRWQEVNSNTHRYLYLQANPVVWLCALIGIIFAAALIIGHMFFGLTKKPKHWYLLLVFFGMYASYMLAISQLNRVMYLYHYFTPLMFSFILFALAYENMEHIGRKIFHEHGKVIGLTVICVLIFVSYQVYRPLSYYEPITKSQVLRRAIFPYWELTCVGCDKVSRLVVPRTCQ